MLSLEFASSICVIHLQQVRQLRQIPLANLTSLPIF